MKLSFHNTRTRQLDVFEPLSGNGSVSLYACGPTVYNYAHVGNLRTYIFEDILRRALRYAGYKVKHVMNITDVGHLTDDGDEGEDKMLLAAKRSGKDPWQIAAFYTDAFFADCERLNIERPEIVCRATDHIDEMIGMIRQLEAGGYTYEAGGNIYFDVGKFERYGDFALLDRMERRDAVNVDLDANKRSPQDFVLWFTQSKFENQIMVWDSPWGRGYPGWHIECSAMSRKYLGDQFDIHCGGVDHIPVHHTNEIAQTEAATGTSPMVRYWLHGEFLLMSQAKMSKASGDFLTLARLEESGFEALDYRYFCLGAHYRTQLNYSEEALKAAGRARAGLARKLAELGAAEYVGVADAASNGASEHGADSSGAGAAGANADGTKPAIGAAERDAPAARANVDGASPAGGTSPADGAPAAGNGTAAPGAGLPGAVSAKLAAVKLAAEARAVLEAFEVAVADDLNMPRALAQLWAAVRHESLEPEQILALVARMDSVFGLRLLETAASLASEPQVSQELRNEVEALIVERREARARKDFARADEIRSSLAERGITLTDTPTGTEWKLERQGGNNAM